MYSSVHRIALQNNKNKKKEIIKAAEQFSIIQYIETLQENYENSLQIDKKYLYNNNNQIKSNEIKGGTPINYKKYRR